MSLPLFPKLEPNTRESFWYCAERHRNDVADIEQIEHDHENWVAGINDRFRNETPLGTPIQVPPQEDEDDEEEEDDDDDEEETDESHDNDNEDASFNNGSINGEIMQIAPQSADPIRNRLNRPSRWSPLYFYLNMFQAL